MLWSVRLVICWLALKLSSGEENIELEIAQGKLKGLKNITVYHGVPFYSFRGIPYAKPNVGRDRFNVAVPLDNWSGILDATKHGNSCVQVNRETVQGHEDCLFLNVYTLDLNKTARRAVMVFIHGGGFYTGSGNDFWYGPDFLIEKDVVLVTMNYRLGIIGFLNTGDANAPGNVALKDQNLALKWVQKNIMDFGGSPDRVTLFGQSAGAVSVHFHMLSPMSQGLFHRAILHSGAAVNARDFNYDPIAAVENTGNRLSSDMVNMTTMVEILRNVSSKDLLMAADFPTLRSLIFTPTLETHASDDVFVPYEPWYGLTMGNISDVPVMIGITEDEFGFISEPRKLYSQRHSLDQLVPIDLELLSNWQTDAITDALSKFYFNGLSPSLKPSAFRALLNDVFANNGPLMTAVIMNARISSPVYAYQFNYYSPLGFDKRRFGSKPRVVLYDDLEFLFYSALVNNVPQLNSERARKTDEMVEMWTNFAKEGNPSATMTAAKVEWKPMNTSNFYLDIGSELEVKKDLLADRIEFWAHLYRDIIGSYVELFE